MVLFSNISINFQNLKRCLSILSFASSVVVTALKIKLQSEDSERSNSHAACFNNLIEKSSINFLDNNLTKTDPAFVISGTIHAFLSLSQ